MLVNEILTHEAAITWLPWAVQYFFMVALAYAAVWVAASEVMFRQACNKRLLKLCAVLMIATAIVAPVALLADLHQPARAWHFYAQLRPTSWMWFGAMLLPIFIGLSLVFGWVLLRDDIAQRGRSEDAVAKLCRLITPTRKTTGAMTKLLAVAASVSGLSIALYTGMEVMVVEARDLWHTPFVPLIFALTAIVAALGALVVLNQSLYAAQAAQQQGRDTQHYLLQRLGIAVFATAVLIQAWVYAGGDSLAQASHLYRLSPVWTLAADWILLTFVALALLLVMALKAPRIAGLMSALVALHLAWGVRWVVLIEGQTAPKYGAGTYFYQIDWGPEGVLGIAATFGLLLAVVVLLSELIRTGDPCVATANTQTNPHSNNQTNTHSNIQTNDELGAA